jgi:hypothetical protein
VYKKVKRLLHRTGQDLGVPEPSVDEGGMFVSPTHRPLIGIGNIPGTHFWAKMRPERFH